MLATTAAKHRDDPSTSDGTTLAQAMMMPAAKRKTTPKQSARSREPVRKPLRWDEVLDAAFALDHCDFLAVLCEMLMVRHEKEELAKQRYARAYGPSDDIPFEDPLDDDFFDNIPAAIPLAPRRNRARKR